MLNSVALKYFIRVKNIGDQVNPLLVNKILNTETFWCKNNELSHLLAIGSILNSANAHSYVWGSGLMFPDIQNTTLDAKKILALRGKKTRDALSRYLTLNDNIPLGDPGYLVAEALGYGDSTKTTKKYKLGIIPHYVDYLNPHLQSFIQKNDCCTLIDVALPAKQFFDALSECENIISSSLHGLVFAESLNIPNAWCEFSNNVAGDGFKFFDWYSLCDNPQKKAIAIKKGNDFKTLLNLTQHCELRKPDIDNKALKQALLNARDNLISHNHQVFLSVEECRKKPTPIFIISYNRGHYLEQIIDGYKKQDRPVDIIIHDNGSDDVNTKKILANIEQQGIKVCYKEKIHCADELNNVSETINDYFQNWSEPQEYIVTDCDIDLSTSQENTITIYLALLSKFNRADCVGPMLTIIDIPKAYVLRNKALNRHILQFWHKKPKKVIYDKQEIFYIPAPIDTTFALYRAGSEYQRLKQGLRLYNPFEAKHLDWYELEKNNIYSQKSNSQISHWNNEQFKKENQDEKLNYSSFYIVQKNKNNEHYSIVKIIIQSNIFWLTTMRRCIPDASRKISDKISNKIQKIIKRLGC